MVSVPAGQGSAELSRSQVEAGTASPPFPGCFAGSSRGGIAGRQAGGAGG